MSVIAKLREAISELHSKIEDTPFSVALIRSEIGPKDYARNCSELWHIHETLEKAVDSNAALAPFFSPAMIRTPALERDLAYWGCSIDSFEPLQATLDIVAQIEAWGRSNPWALLGCIYVLEGSRMGSLVIARPLAKGLGVQPQTGNGVDYHTENARETPNRMQQWKMQIDSQPFTESQVIAIAHGAVEFMRLLNALYLALPCNGERVAPLSVVSLSV